MKRAFTRRNPVFKSFSQLCATTALCLAGTFGAVSGAAAKDVTDVLGRTVHVPDHVQRVVLGEGRLMSAFALLDRDKPFARIVGW